MRQRTRITIAVAWACLALTASVRAALTQQEVADLFTQANHAFRSANTQTDPSSQQQLYEKAVLTYERLIQEGTIHNARLYYNLANAHLLKGDLGRAILNYRRAERIDSGDVNIQKNLAFARTRRIDSIPVKTEQQVLRTLLFWHYDFSLKTRFGMACLAFACLCLGVTTMVWRGRSSPTLATTAIAAIVLIGMAGSVAAQTRQQSSTVYGVITATQVVARQGDGPNYPESFKAPLHPGTEFELIERRPRWLHIRLTDGSEGWIPNEAAETL
jgi:hypothetical protein